MVTGLHWLATSERERRRALQLAHALQQKESRDELGIGTVRDALADRLFPGTSTLHTRARYHLFIPWAYQRAAAQRGSTPMSARVRNAEAEVIRAFKTNDADLSGLIGRDAGPAVKRMPSTLYWQGLAAWGIRRASGSQAVVERLMTRHASPTAVRDDDGMVLDPSAFEVWHPNLPRMPVDHPAESTFDLEPDEADFLSERLRTEPGTRGSALAQLIELPDAHEERDRIWMHPRLGELAPETRHVIEQGRRFSLLMHGAAWLYNVVLAELRESRELATDHRESYSAWATDVVQAGDDLGAWDITDLWGICGEQVPVPARLFVRRWQELVVTHGPHLLVDRTDARDLIISRERAMKKQHARTLNRKALEQWGGSSGTFALDYRWTTARVLLADIQHGVETADA